MRVTKRTVASKRSQGSGWVVSTYAPEYNSWVESGEMDYWKACRAVKEARETWNTKKQQYFMKNRVVVEIKAGIVFNIYAEQDIDVAVLDRDIIRGNDVINILEKPGTVDYVYPELNTSVVNEVFDKLDGE